MDVAEFDQFADEYSSMHAANIAITGERPEFFSEYKIRLLRQDTQKINGGSDRILDFGCGTGNSIPFFHTYHPGVTLTSADVSRRSLDVARQRFPGKMQELLLEGPRIDVADNSFDVAFSACVFHHIPHAEHRHWLEELRRVVRPGGMVAIFEHNPLNPLTVRAVNTCPFDANARLIRATAMKRSLRSAGWRAPAAHYHVFFPHRLAALRPIEPLLVWLPLGAQYSVTATKA
jgi:SAM-dependent methyltransferase